MPDVDQIDTSSKPNNKIAHNNSAADNKSSGDNGQIFKNGSETDHSKENEEIQDFIEEDQFGLKERVSQNSDRLYNSEFKNHKNKLMEKTLDFKNKPMEQLGYEELFDIQHEVGINNNQIVYSNVTKQPQIQENAVIRTSANKKTKPLHNHNSGAKAPKFTAGDIGKTLPKGKTHLLGRLQEDMKDLSGISKKFELFNFVLEESKDGIKQYVLGPKVNSGLYLQENDCMLYMVHNAIIKSIDQDTLKQKKEINLIDKLRENITRHIIDNKEHKLPTDLHVRSVSKYITNWQVRLKNPLDSRDEQFKLFKFCLNKVVQDYRAKYKSDNFRDHPDKIEKLNTFVELDEYARANINDSSFQNLLKSLEYFEININLVLGNYGISDSKDPLNIYKQKGANQYLKDDQEKYLCLKDAEYYLLPFGWVITKIIGNKGVMSNTIDFTPENIEKYTPDDRALYVFQHYSTGLIHMCLCVPGHVYTVTTKDLSKIINYKDCFFNDASSSYDDFPIKKSASMTKRQKLDDENYIEREKPHEKDEGEAALKILELVQKKSQYYPIKEVKEALGRFKDLIGDQFLSSQGDAESANIAFDNLKVFHERIYYIMKCYADTKSVSEKKMFKTEPSSLINSYMSGCTQNDFFKYLTLNKFFYGKLKKFYSFEDNSAKKPCDLLEEFKKYLKDEDSYKEKFKPKREYILKCISIPEYTEDEKIKAINGVNNLVKDPKKQKKGYYPIEEVKKALGGFADIIVDKFHNISKIEEGNPATNITFINLEGFFKDLPYIIEYYIKLEKIIKTEFAAEFKPLIKVCTRKTQDAFFQDVKNNYANLLAFCNTVKDDSVKRENAQVLAKKFKQHLQKIPVSNENHEDQSQDFDYNEGDYQNYDFILGPSAIFVNLAPPKNKTYGAKGVNDLMQEFMRYKNNLPASNENHEDQSQDFDYSHDDFILKIGGAL